MAKYVANSATPDRREPWNTSRIHAPLSPKQKAANAREFKRETAPVVPPEVTRERSRKRKVYISAWQRFNHERFIRRGMTAKQLEEREALLPLAWYAPGSSGYVGTMQEVDE